MVRREPALWTIFLRHRLKKERDRKLELHNPIIEDNKKKVEDIYNRLQVEKKEYLAYKDMLSNMWRVMRKVYKKTEEQLVEIDKSIKMIEGVRK